MTRSRRGAAAIEFALCLPLTVLLMAGIVDLGRAISFQHMLQRAARDAARVAAALTTNDAGLPAEEADIEAAAVAHAQTAVEISIPSCDTCEYEATWATASDGNEYIEVSIRAPLEPIFGIIPGMVDSMGNRFTVMTRVQEE